MCVVCFSLQDERRAALACPSGCGVPSGRQEFASRSPIGGEPSCQCGSLRPGDKEGQAEAGGEEAEAGVEEAAVVAEGEQGAAVAEDAATRVNAESEGRAEEPAEDDSEEEAEEEEEEEEVGACESDSDAEEDEEAEGEEEGEEASSEVDWGGDEEDDEGEEEGSLVDSSDDDLHDKHDQGGEAGAAATGAVAEEVTQVGLVWFRFHLSCGFDALFCDCLCVGLFLFVGALLYGSCVASFLWVFEGGCVVIMGSRGCGGALG